MDKNVWYHAGLEFECTGCGNCCTGAPGVVWVDDEDIRTIADFCGVGEGEIRVMHTRPYAGKTSLTEFANGDCTFFDPSARRCTIYPVRPSQCRTWPFWTSNLANEETWAEVQTGCPGIGRGRLFEVDEIETLAGAGEV